MRSFAMAILMAIGLGLAVTSGAVAARINAASIGKSASEISPVTTIHYTGYYHRHRYRPYYYGYGYGYGYPYGFYFITVTHTDPTTAIRTDAGGGDAE